MKKLLAILFVIVIAGCNTTGSPWDSTGAGQASTAPSRLTSQVPESANGPQSYTPYNSPADKYSHDTALKQQQQNGQVLDHYAQTMDEQHPDRQAYDHQDGTDGFQSADGTSGYYGDQGGYDYRQPATLNTGGGLPAIRVALLLPLTGQHADLGQAMLQASQLALFDIGYDAFELMPRDTQGTPQGAAQAAQSAAADGAQLILGPLFASSVRAAKPVASRYNINMVAFSTDWSLAGGNTYIMGFLPFAQVQRVSEYASSKGIRDIGILAPNTDYGNAVIAAYNSLAYRTGLNTAEVVRFSAEEKDISGVVRSFTRYDQRAEALEKLKKPLRKKLAKNPDDRAVKKELAELEKIEVLDELPFKAVLLPVGGDQARSVSNLLSYYDAGPSEIKRLGTGLWDDPGLATEPALDGSWFAAPSPDLRKGFESRYRDLYASKPPRLASLSYDATALAAVLAKQSYQRTGQTSFTRTALLNPNGFAGIDGIFRFRPDGLVERGLAVLEFKDGGIRVIDPAPSTFQNESY